MSKLNRVPWQLHVMPDEENEGRLKIVTNTFKLSDMTIEDLPFAVIPFVGCSGKIEINIYDAVGTEEQRKELYDILVNMFQKQKRAVGFYTPVHSSLHTYWFNVLSKREKFDIRTLKGIAKGRPVVYAGAGPSLEKNAETLKKIAEQKKAFIITGGTGMMLLDKYGISPDLCLALDPFEQEFERFENLSEEFQKNTVLLASPSLNPKCFEFWKGPLIAAEGLNCMPVGDFIEDNPEHLDEGPIGCTTWLFSVLEYIKAEEVYMAGADYCFGENGATYAEDLDLTCSDFSEVIEVQGKKTKPNWLVEMNWVSEKVGEMGIKAFNASYGLTLDNFTNGFKLEELLNRQSFNSDIKLIKWTKSKYENIRNRCKEFADLLDDAIDNLGNEDIESHPGYIYLLEQYDRMQEYHYWRTSTYNYSLLREVLSENAKLIRNILFDNIPYYPNKFGHMGSPFKSTTVGVAKTGSAYTAEKENSRAV